MKRSHRPRLAALMVGAGLLAACTSGGEETTPTTPATDGGGSTASTLDGDFGRETAEILFESPNSDDFNKLLTSQDDLIALGPVEVLGVDTDPGAGPDPTTLIVSFEMESHYCWGVHTEVAETDNEIIIEVLTGQLPGTQPTNCEYGVFPYTTAIELDAPLGDRTISTAEQREPADSETALGATPPHTNPDGEPVADPDAPTTTTPDEPETTPPTPQIPLPNEQSPIAAAEGPVALLGNVIEDGVEWAILNDVEWRVLSFDGVPTEASPADPTRLSFVVENDRIVDYEWS